jgi:hypothetical protein
MHYADRAECEMHHYAEEEANHVDAHETEEKLPVGERCRRDVSFREREAVGRKAEQRES